MKAGVIGVGKLGGAIAFELAQGIPWDELVLVDALEGLAWAQAEDIRHGLPGPSPCPVRAGELGDLRDADVIVLAAGKGRAPGMTRLDLLHANAGLVASLAEAIGDAAPNAALVVLTNPVDVLTVVAWRASGLPREKVLGSGTLVDSVRFRAILADRFRARPSDVDAVTLGEHGDRVVPVFSRATLRGQPIELDPGSKREIVDQLRGLAVRIIEGKGGTAFGPAGCTAALVAALVAPDSAVIPASVVLQGEYGLRDVALGVPAVLARGRLVKVEEWPLRSDEQAGLQEAGHDLARHVEDAVLVIERAVRHVTLDDFAGR